MDEASNCTSQVMHSYKYTILKIISGGLLFSFKLKCPVKEKSNFFCSSSKYMKAFDKMQILHFY